MTDEQLRDAVITELLNTLPFHKILDLVQGFAEAVADQQLESMTDEQKAELITRFVAQPQEEGQEEPDLDKAPIKSE